MDAGSVISIVAAAISLASFGAALFQARRAADQVAVAQQQVAEARRQTDLQQRMHEDAAQPYVYVDIRPDEGSAQLAMVVLTNIGPTVATDIEVEFDPPLQEPDGETLDGLADVVPSLPPGQSMRWTLGVAHRVYEPSSATTYRATVRANGPFGPCTPLTYTIDLGAWSHTRAVPSGTLHELKRSLDAIAKAVSKRS